jgi:hypothetical protein
MKRTRWILPLVCLPALVISGAASAGWNPSAWMAIHVKPHGTSCTDGFPTFTSCSQITTTYWDTGDIDVIPVLYNLLEYTQIGIAMDWPAEWGTMSWVRCKGDGQIGTLTDPNTYARIYWSTCQHAWSVAPGYGWLYATGQGWVGSSVTIRSLVYDCQPTPDADRACPGWSGIGGVIGNDPCSASATEQTSWGRVKAIFGE